MSEPLLRGNEIQGDSLAGFRKDHVRLLFLKFDPQRIELVKKWLRGLVPRLATLNAVAQFNDAFRIARRSLRALDPEAMRPPDPQMYALWVNVAFTAAAGAAWPGRNGIKLKLAAVPAIKALRSMAFLPCSLASSEAADVYRLLIVSS